MRYESIVRSVALVLGLRQSEALALQWRDIDLLDNSLSVRRSRSEGTLSLPMPLVVATNVATELVK